MTKQELIDRCSHSNVLWAEHTRDGVEGILLHWDDPRAGEECVFVDPTALPAMKWGAVYSYLVAGRDVHHITRIVGYYSRVQNWNPSKLGELKGRHAGSYGVPPNSDALDKEVGNGVSTS